MGTLERYEKEGLKPVGYWRSEYEPELPMPEESGGWDPHDLELLCWYLDEGEVHARYRGFSHCRLCDKVPNGSADLTDGVWVWPEGLSHYLREHQIKLPLAFTFHVSRELERLGKK